MSENGVEQSTSHEINDDETDESPTTATLDAIPKVKFNKDEHRRCSRRRSLCHYLPLQ
jgi:hypothetical protein